MRHILVIYTSRIFPDLIDFTEKLCGEVFHFKMSARQENRSTKSPTVKRLYSKNIYTVIHPCKKMSYGEKSDNSLTVCNT